MFKYFKITRCLELREQRIKECIKTESRDYNECICTRKIELRIVIALINRNKLKECLKFKTFKNDKLE